MSNQMQHESGGDERAQNNWDSNARAGVPSKGLLQFIDPTFQAYADPGFTNIWDPEAQMRAFMNYVPAVYGSRGSYDYLTSIGYSAYDSGGWLPQGLSVAVNKTGQQERILAPGQYHNDPEQTANSTAILAVLQEILEENRTLREEFRRMPQRQATLARTGAR